MKFSKGFESSNYTPGKILLKSGSIKSEWRKWRWCVTTLCFG
jgi:hypothetical protein